MRREFTNRYPSVKPALLRSMYNFLREDASAPVNAAIASVDYRLEECLLAADDPDLVYDLCRNNGRVCDTRYDPFWEELQRYLDEKAAVHERRQADHLYLPFAVSVDSLRREITSRLPDDTPIPSASSLWFNFWPRNPYTYSAMAYTGRFKVKFAIQQ